MEGVWTRNSSIGATAGSSLSGGNRHGSRRGSSPSPGRGPDFSYTSSRRCSSFPDGSEAGVEEYEGTVGPADRTVGEDGVTEVCHVIEGHSVLSEVEPRAVPARLEVQRAARALARRGDDAPGRGPGRVWA